MCLRIYEYAAKINNLNNNILVTVIITLLYLAL